MQDLPVTVSSNVDIEVEIPSDVDWISKAPATKAMTDKVITLKITENGNSERTAKVTFKNTATNVSETITVNQTVLITILLNEGETLESKITNPLEIKSLVVAGKALTATDFYYIRDDLSNLKSLDISKTVTTTLPSRAFDSHYKIISIKLPKSITIAKDYVFNDCVSLSFVDMPEGMRISNKISSSMYNIYGDYMFKGCRSLTSITIPGSFRLVTSSLFKDSYFHSITISEGVTELESQLVQYLTTLTSIDVPNSIIRIGSRAFCYRSGLTSINIPEGIEIIRAFTYSDCRGLTSIDIPNSVKFISNSAFSGCSGLTSITIPDGLLTIDDYTFARCSRAISIIIPNSVTKINDHAFYGCIKLTSITIPANVAFIGNSTFDYCSKLTSITCLADEPPVLFDNSFGEENKTLKYIYVPTNSLKAYKEAPVWINFANIIKAIQN